jgi:hypothetical protein
MYWMVFALLIALTLLHAFAFGLGLPAFFIFPTIHLIPGVRWGFLLILCSIPFGLIANTLWWRGQDKAAPVPPTEEARHASARALARHLWLPLLVVSIFLTSVDLVVGYSIVQNPVAALSSMGPRSRMSIGVSSAIPSSKNWRLLLDKGERIRESDLILHARLSLPGASSSRGRLKILNPRLEASHRHEHSATPCTLSADTQREFVGSFPDDVPLIMRVPCPKETRRCRLSVNLAIVLEDGLSQQLLDSMTLTCPIDVSALPIAPQE